MSDVDGFVQEVTEELRRDRMLKLWKSWGPAVIGAVVLVVAGTAILEWRGQRDAAAAQAAGAQLLEARESVTSDAKILRFDEAAAALQDGPALVAKLGAAAARAEAGEAKAAADALLGLSDLGSVDPLLRDVAAFKAALLGLADQDPAARIETMSRFSAEGAPFRLLALEQIAAAKILTGDMEGARTDIMAAMADPLATRALRERLSRMIQLLPVPAEEEES